MNNAVVNEVIQATGNLIGKAHFVLECDRLKENQKSKSVVTKSEP